MKKIIKIFIVFCLFFLSVGFVNAFEAKLQVDKNKIGVGDIINLNFEIKTETGGEIKIQGIKNLDKFQVLGQSRSSSIESRIVSINGQTKSQTITTYNLRLTLRVLQKGEFEIGPAIIKQGNRKIETNSILLKVGKGFSALNGNITNNNTINIGNKPLKSNNSGEDKEQIEKKYFDNSYYLYILVFLIILGVGGYIYLNREKLVSNDIENNKEKTNGEDLEDKEEEVEIEENLESDFVYPDINDKNFVEKIDEIFRKKLKNKYKIKDIYSLTYNEILQKVDDENIKDIIELLNKVKYGNLIVDKTKILELIKKI